MPKVKIHPLFLALSVLLIWINGIICFVSAITAVLLHETAHAIMARERGFVAESIRLLPFGAQLYCEDNLDKTSNVLIALAGPLTSFLLAFITVSMWWIYPPCYPYTEYFAFSNLVIGAFNLIPVYPLDGARILLALSKKKAKTLRILKILGIALSVILFALFLISLFFTYNLTLGLMAVFLYVGATDGTEREMYSHILSDSPYTKNYLCGVYEKTIIVDSSVTLLHLIKLTDSKTVATFKILHENKIAAALSERELIDLIGLKSPKTRIKDCLTDLVKRR